MGKADMSLRPIKINKIINDIEDGDIKIPAFQRGFVWNQEQVIRLLESIYHNYPIGSILLWNSMERLRATRNIAGFEISDREPSYPVNYVLDGQQRLSSIYAIFCKTRKAYSDDLDYDDKIFEISFDLDDKIFIPTNEIEPGHIGIELHKLSDFQSLMKAIKGFSDEQVAAAQDLYYQFINYELPTTYIYNRDKDEVGIIFERINSSATTLTTLDLMVAWTWSEEFQLREKIDELRASLDSKGFDALPDRVVLQCIGGILCRSTKIKNILSLDAKDVRFKFEMVVKSILGAIDFLSTELHVSSYDLLPHNQQIVPLSYFFSKGNRPDCDELRALKHWFWLTSFSNRYSSQTDSKMDQDIEYMEEISEGITSPSSHYSYDFDSLMLTKQRMKKNNPFARAFLILMAQKKPKDLIDGGNIDLYKALSGFNRKEYHHVFPQKFLKGKDKTVDEINLLFNYCFLSSASNKKIGGKPPSNYIIHDIPLGLWKDVVGSNLLPLNKNLYEDDNYEGFIQERSQLVIQYLHELLA